MPPSSLPKCDAQASSAGAARPGKFQANFTTTTAPIWLAELDDPRCLDDCRCEEAFHLDRGTTLRRTRMAFRASILSVATGVGLIANTPTVGAQGRVLEVVKQRGSLSCGVHIGLAGFGQPDDKGNWTGLDVDYCKAIAAAIFGDDKKVKFVPTTAKKRLTALQSGEIDVLIRSTTWTLSRESALGLSFAGVNAVGAFRETRRLAVAYGHQVGSLCPAQRRGDGRNAGERRSDGRLDEDPGHQAPVRSGRRSRQRHRRSTTISSVKMVKGRGQLRRDLRSQRWR